MKINIECRPSFAVLKVVLSPDEVIKAEPGSLLAHKRVKISTGRGSKSIMGTLKRSLAGESFFLNTFKAGPSGGEVYLAPATPGDIKTFNLVQNQDLFVQGGSFLACSDGVELDTKFQGMKGLFNREGLFFLKVMAKSGPGQVFVNSYGAILEFPVNAGEDLVVDNGHMVAFTSGVEYTINRIGGLKSMLIGGEGLVMTFRGQGKVWIQTRALSGFASQLVPYFKK